MAKLLKIAGTNGCCACTHMVSACSCSENQCSLECQSKAATAELCGFDEFTAPSIPPKRYLKCTFSGTINGLVYTGSTCSDSTPGYFSEAYSGAAELSRSGCTQLTTGTQVISEQGSVTSTTALTAPTLSGWDTDCFQTLTLTSTSAVDAQTNACCSVNGGVAYQKHSGSRTQVLDLEDTEADAITRALGALPWSASDCIASPAYWTQRGAGQFTFGIRNVQVRAHAGVNPQPPLIVGHSYKITVGYYRRIVGSSGPWIFYGQDEVTVLAENAQEATPWLDVPNEAGWETSAQTCAIVDVTLL